MPVLCNNFLGDKIFHPGEKLKFRASKQLKCFGKSLKLTGLTRPFSTQILSPCCKDCWKPLSEKQSHVSYLEKILPSLFALYHELRVSAFLNKRHAGVGFW